MRPTIAPRRGKSWHRVLSAALTVLLVMTSLGGPLSRPAASHSPPTPIQPTQFPGYGTQWWDHWWSEAFVARDVGTVTCTVGTVCAGLYDGDRFSIGVAYWTDATCYGDGCGSMNVEMWQGGVEISGDGINNGATRDDARNHANAGGYYFPPFSHPTPASNAAVFTYCKWVFVDLNGIATGCSLNGEAGRVRTSQLANLHFMWAATSGDGTVRGNPRGDFYEVTATPAGYPAPGVPNDRANYGRRCATAGAVCDVRLDFASDKPFAFGRGGPSPFSQDPVNLATGNFTAQADDLALPGRVLGFSFARSYNSADPTTGPLGPGWTHAYNWSLRDSGTTIEVRRGDGRRDTFTRNADGSYAAPPDLFDTLVKNVGGTFTLTLTSQVLYEFSIAGQLTRIREPAGNQITLAYTAGNLSMITDTVGRTVTLSYDTDTNRLVALQDPLGRRVTYWYDARGRLVGVRDKLANAGLPSYGSVVLADAPAGYWNLDEPSGTIVADSGPGRVNGATAGGATRGRSGVGFSNSTLFDGATGNAAIPSAAAFNFGLGNYSAEAWVWRTAQGSNTYPVIVSKRPWVSATEPGWAITLTTADPTKVGLHIGNLDMGSPGMQTAGGLITVNLWHHIALVYTAVDRQGRLYVDGSLALTTPATDGTTGATSTAAISLAQNNAGTGDRLAGKIDEVAIYGTALSAARVLAHYRAGIPAPSWAYTYDGVSSHITTITDPDGRVRVTNSYDAQGRVFQQRDGLTQLTQIAYNPTNTVLTDPRNHATTYTFDARMRELNESDLVGTQTYTLSYSYDAAGNRKTVTDHNGKTTDFSYDGRGNVLTKTDPQVDPLVPRYVTQFEYDAKNNLFRITDSRRFTTVTAYDPVTNVLQSVTRQIDATTSAVTKYQYGDPANPGLPTAIVAPRGNLTAVPDLIYASTLGYDAQGNLTSRSDPDGATTTYIPDPIGRVTSRVDPDGNALGGVPAQHTWSTVYDENNRVIRETDPLSRFTQYGYDGAGNRTRLTDRTGNLSSYTYDPNTRLRTVQQQPDPVGQPTLTYTTTVNRDPNGNATQIVQANAATTDYAFDALNRLTRVTTHPSPTLALSTSYVLDGNGNPTTKTAGDGVAVTNQYDALNRLSSMSATGIALSFGYDASSNRIQMTDGTGTTTYQYDGLGRTTQVAAPGGTLGYAYDLDGNRTTLGYPGLLSVNYAYTPGGRLDTVTDWSLRATAYGYKDSGLVATVAYPNGMTTAYSYDTAQHLTAVRSAIGLPAVTVSSHIYTVDNEGNRTALEEFVSGITPPATVDRFTYAYDGLNRLKSATGPVAESFTLDGASNITGRTGPAATYAIDGSNRPTGDGTSALVWSNADQLTARAADSFGYDSLSRLTSSTVAATARSYTYNGGGLLGAATTGATTTNYLWDSSRAPAPVLQIGTTRIVYGLGPLYAVDPLEATTAFAVDGLGSVRAELNDAGTVTNTYRYAAYGRLAQSLAGAPQVLGFAGELLDRSGLIYLRARWYDPSVARLLTSDPVEGSAASPASLNQFGYASANPVSFADPAGTCADPNPGSSQPRYCVAAFIPTGDVCVLLRCYQGDGRGPSAYGGTSRIELHMTPDGLSAHSDPTVRLTDAASAQGVPQCGASRRAITCTGQNPLEGGAPPITFTVSFARGHIRLYGTHFPSFEVWRYGAGGADLIIQNQAWGSGPLGLGALLGLNLPGVLGESPK